MKEIEVQWYKHFQHLSLSGDRLEEALGHEQTE